jgi:hypothetical protein
MIVCLFVQLVIFAFILVWVGGFFSFLADFHSDLAEGLAADILLFSRISLKG